MAGKTKEAPLIYFLPEKKEVAAGEGETILLASFRAGIPLTNVCGGSGRCSTCRVAVAEGLEHCSPRTPEEEAIAETLRFPPHVRLACQTTVSGRVKVRRLVEDLEDIDFDSLFIQGAEAVAIGEEKNVLILFADIQGFTTFAEDLLPYDVIYVLNLYFRRMGEITRRYGGRIDNYMGDGFIALFEAADPVRGALAAVQAGLEMLDSVNELGPYLGELYHRSFHIRIGLHYGKVVAGKLGHSGHKKMTVIGDAVNLASRIEAANKAAGTRFLISAETYALVQDQVLVGRQVHVDLPGKSGKYRLYEVVGLSRD